MTKEDLVKEFDRLIEAHYNEEIDSRDEWLREVIDLKHSVVKNLIIPDVSTRTEMRKQAITVFELTKGFTGEPTDNAMKTALEMADYVMRLTNDL